MPGPDQNELDRIQSNRIKSVQSHGSGHATPKGAPVPGHAFIHITNRKGIERESKGSRKGIERESKGNRKGIGRDYPVFKSKSASTSEVDALLAVKLLRKAHQPQRLTRFSKQLYSKKRVNLRG